MAAVCCASYQRPGWGSAASRAAGREVIAGRDDGWGLVAGVAAPFLQTVNTPFESTRVQSWVCLEFSRLIGERVSQGADYAIGADGGLEPTPGAPQPRRLSSAPAAAPASRAVLPSCNHAA